MYTRTVRAFLFALPLLLSAPYERASGAPADEVRQAFTAAMQRVRANQPDIPDSDALETYVLHDYLVAARLRRDLAQHPDEGLDAGIDAFLQGHGTQPVTRPLRREWLLSLAQRRRWDWYLPRSADLTEPVLVCQRLVGRLSGGDTQGLAAPALERWSAPQRPPAECADVFAWLRQQNLLTPALAEARTRAALAADNPKLARDFAADVPVPKSAPLLQWSDLLESPKTALTVLAAHPDMSVEPDALASGFDKLSHSDIETTLTLLPQLLARAGMTPELQARLERSAALGAAYDHDARAMPLFGRLPATGLDPQVEEWRVRSALWFGDWTKVREWTEHMPPSLATLPRWRYWHARAVEASAGDKAAEASYAEIADLRDYYGYLAADRLHRAYHLNARPSPDDSGAQASLSSEPGLIRAHELFACDMTDEAGVEWATVVGGADPARKVQAAHLASRWGWYAQAIATLAQAAEWDDVKLRYPRPYPEAVAQASGLANVQVDWIYAVMRQESLYRKDAVSRADARGLMQMLPVTASAVARRWHLAPPRKEALFDPTVAVPLGAAYLREMLDRYAGRLPLTLAAYNAGPNPVARWQPSSSLEADIWIENIPYNETRGYVQHILEHIVAFAWARDAELPRLQTLLTPLGPEAP